MSREEPKFSVGSRVRDTRKDDAATDGRENVAARVVDPDAGHADEVEVGGMPLHRYEKNERYPRTDRVVAVAFEDDLSVVDGWRRAEDLAARLEAFREKWGAPIRRYHYPESRLEPAPLEVEP